MTVRDGDPRDDAYPGLVLAALLRDEDEALTVAERLGVPTGALAAWRNAVIDAGLAVLADRLEPVGWVQVDVIAVTWAALVAGPLLDRLSEWVDAGVVSNTWFVHKPPGLRLRLEGERERLRSLLSPLLDEIVAAGGATGWRFGFYLPETHLFGGPVGMALAHRFFTADSLAVLGYHRARQERSVRLGPTEFSLLLLDGCLTRLVPDPWERWDVWCRLRWTGRILDQSAPPGAAPAKLPDDAVGWVRAVRSLPGPWPGASRQEQAILYDYLHRIESLADQTRVAIEAGEPVANLRLSLPFWIVFHWNRLGFSPEAQRAITRVVIAGIDPRGPAID